MTPPLMMYFYYAFAVNVFRVTMYVINLEGATVIKVSKEAWEDKRIQEEMYVHTRMIR